MVKGRKSKTLGGVPKFKETLSTPRQKAKRVWSNIHLREWREYRGLSTEKLAEKAGVSPGLISQIENGISGGSPGSLEKLAKALGCEVGEILDIAPSKGGSLMRVWVSDEDRPRVEAVARALSRIKSQ